MVKPIQNRVEREVNQAVYRVVDRKVYWKMDLVVRRRVVNKVNLQLTIQQREIQLGLLERARN